MVAGWCGRVRELTNCWAEVWAGFEPSVLGRTRVLVEALVKTEAEACGVAVPCPVDPDESAEAVAPKL